MSCGSGDAALGVGLLGLPATGLAAEGLLEKRSSSSSESIDLAVADLLGAFCEPPEKRSSSEGVALGLAGLAALLGAFCEPPENRSSSSDNKDLVADGLEAVLV
jgi:hypothetical protein